jgi:hypothetical protein
MALKLTVRLVLQLVAIAPPLVVALLALTVLLVMLRVLPGSYAARPPP